MPSIFLLLQGRLNFNNFATKIVVLSYEGNSEFFFL